MRKITLLIASFLLTIGAMAQNFVMPEQGKYYKIKGDNSQYPWLMGVQKSGGSGAAVSDNENDAAIFLKTENGLQVVETGKYLYYAGSGDVTIGNTESRVTIGEYSTRTDNGVKYSIKVDGAYMFNNNTDKQVHTSGTFLNIERYWGFIEVQYNEAAKNNLKVLLDQVIGWDTQLGMLGDAVGQYSSPNFTKEFVALQEYSDAITSETPVEEIQAKIDELEKLISSLTLNMPVDGKAYTFKNVQADGTTYSWFTYDNTSNKIELTKDKNAAAVFVCRKLDDNGNYAFALNNGKYLAWRGSDAGCNEASGVCDAYDETWTQVKITKMTTATNYDSGVDMSSKPYMLISGRRSTDSGNNEFNYFVVKKNGGTPIFDQANAPFYKKNHNGDSFSSAFVIEDAEYANIPALNTIFGDLVNFKGSIATFSAPFPTVAPAGVTAYYVTESYGNCVSLKAVEGAIPANEGVLLVGSEDMYGQIVMKPRTTESIATITGNLLENSAGAAKDMSGVQDAYILASYNGAIGYYACAGGTLAMNKSYLKLPSNLKSLGIRLPGATAIEEVETENAEVEVIYDLCGRRVNEITKAGVYIINGKKVLVK